MSLFLDVVTVAVFIIVIYRAFRKGFLRSLAELAGFVVSFVVAYLFSKPAGQWVDETFMHKIVTGSISQFASSGAKGSDTFFSKLAQDVPAAAVQAMSGVGSGLDAVGAKVTAAIIEAVSVPISQLISRGLAFFVILALCFVAVRIIAGAAGLIGKLPLIGTVNSLAGAAVGVVQAIIVMFFISTFVSVAMSFMAIHSDPPINSSTINTTQVYKYVHNMNPLTGMLLKK